MGRFIIIEAIAILILLSYSVLITIRLKKVEKRVEELDEFTSRLSNSLINLAAENGRTQNERDITEKHLASEIESLKAEQGVIKDDLAHHIKDGELSAEEKEALEAYAKAEQAWADGVQNLFNYGYNIAVDGKGGDS